MASRLFNIHQMRAAVRALLDETALRQGTSSKLYRFVHFWMLVWRSFVRNRCPVRASALAYATLLALIPMLVVALSITGSFLKREGEAGIEKFVVRMVDSLTPPAPLNTNAPPPGVEQSTDTRAAAPDPKTESAQKAVARNINQFIQNTRTGTLGVTGSILLIFAAISMLSRIEDTFNDIWGISRGRSWFMRIVLYWAVLTLTPMLLMLALGLATGPHLEASKKLVAHLPLVGHFIVHFGFQLLPILVLCLTFAAFYMLIPNTRVHWRAALVGGLAGGLLFHLNNVMSVLYVSRVVSNSKIYGSLGLVPVFMIGLYLSWLILLFGAQVAYAYQNRAGYIEEKQVENINQRGREFIALRLMTLVGQRYVNGEQPATVTELVEHIGVPTRLVLQLMQTMAAARLVVETAGSEAAYMPARPMETITCHDILLALRASQGQELATRDGPARTEVFGEYERIQEAERKAASGVSMLALVNRAENQLPPKPVKAIS